MITFIELYILKYPKFVFLLMLGVVAFFGYEARNLEFDVSAETLLLENDQDLRKTRQVNERFVNPEFLFITFRPKADLLAESTLKKLKAIADDLLKVGNVESTYSLINVPLLQSPPRPVKEVVKHVPTLEDGNIDLELARKEFVNSPIYRSLLVSPDFKTTAIQVNLKIDETFRDFTKKLQALRDKKEDQTITDAEKKELKVVEQEFKKHRDRMREVDHQFIEEIRAVIAKHHGEDELFLGGAGMMANDMVIFLKNDIKYFGAGVLVLLIFTLGVIFRQLRWVIVPVITCAFSVIITTGILGLFQWEITVISSNFISIQLIITMAITIHLIVRYRELIQKKPEASQHELVLETVTAMWKPCLFTTLTTVAGFTTLLLAKILPVITFGWMMSVGVSLSLVITFIIFPATVVQMGKLPANTYFERHFGLTRFFGNLTEKRGNSIFVANIILGFLIITGISQLIVENSFVTYFKESTEIFKGLKVIDRQLGGTSLLDVVIDLSEEEKVAAEPEEPVEPAGDMEDPEKDEMSDMISDMEEEFEAEKGKAQYWFTATKMERIEKIHDYLDSIPETGKVLSLGTLLKIGVTLNSGKPLDNFMLALMYNELPERFRKIILTPYVSVDHNQARFAIRIMDTNPDLRRNQLLIKIRNDLHEKFGIAQDKIHLTSLLVLYNNVLQQLFASQILTLGAVIAIIMVMFLILFRSAKIAMLAIIPNIIPVGFVLGFMGWADIPLDVMTITIASISLGIAVDDTIHYIHRIRREFEATGNYLQAMHQAHESIGYAMYYTSVTITIGFSILVVSNFIPTIYFGLLTGMAMLKAFLADVTLLPRLIVFFQPFGPEGNNQAATTT